MEFAANIYNDLRTFVGLFDLTESIVVLVNLLLFVFARRILSLIYHESEASAKFKFSVNIFRVFNLFIAVAFTYYHLSISESTRGIGFKIVSILIVLYLCYVSLHLLHYFIRQRYGKTREIDGRQRPVETYNSRLLNIFASVFIFVIALVSVIRLLGYDSLLEAGGAIGIVGVFFALTQSAWAPDMFSGLIILNSGMVEEGQVIEFNDGHNSLGVVFKTKVFHTEILNLVNNHRIMIKNAKLREHTIHNLSKFASAKGLREQLHFKIDYSISELAVREMFQHAYKKAESTPGINIQFQYPLEIAVTDTGDYAVEWCIFYYTKDVKQLIQTRQLFREIILTTSKAENISLATPLRHLAETSDRTDS